MALEQRKALLGGHLVQATDAQRTLAVMPLTIREHVAAGVEVDDRIGRTAWRRAVRADGRVAVGSRDFQLGVSDYVDIGPAKRKRAAHRSRGCHRTAVLWRVGVTPRESRPIGARRQQSGRHRTMLVEVPCEARAQDKLHHTQSGPARGKVHASCPRHAGPFRRRFVC